MIECLIIGDSIAVGMHQFRPECVAYAKGGITSHGWDRRYGTMDLSANVVIISLGSNDQVRDNTYHTLHAIREKIKAKKVFWIAPHEGSKPKAFYDVNITAGRYDDVVLWTNYYQKDKIHPSWAGYKELADQTKK